MARKTLLQFRRDTAANWTSANPTLSAGEPGFETNTGKVKIGDGSTAWNSLSYVNPGASSVATDTIWDTKGDLAVATGADAASKLAAGTDAFVLTADSSQTTGLKWAAAPGAGGAAADGWVDDTVDTWTYASADSPTFTFTIAGDRTAILTPGKRIKLTQTTVKFFIVTAASFSSGTTTVTVYGGTDYTLANAAISANYHSATKAPDGFPLNPAKWTVEVTDTSDQFQSSPVTGTWYNLGSITLSVPIGSWRILYEVVGQYTRASAGSCWVDVTLSTANNSESDTSMTGIIFSASIINMIIHVHRERHLTVASKTSYFLNAKSAQAGASTVEFRGDLAPTLIRAVCAYL